MSSFRFLQILAVAGALLTAVSTLFYFNRGPFPSGELLASNTYLSPTKPIPGNPQLVRVEVLVLDSSDPAGPKSSAWNSTKPMFP